MNQPSTNQDDSEEKNQKMKSSLLSIAPYIAIARFDHWFKNVFVVPGIIVAIYADHSLITTSTGLFTTLGEMGVSITVSDERIEGGEAVGTLSVSHGPLRAVDVAGERAPSMIDEYPILAVACAHAVGVSRLRGLGELRVKESDRLSATAAMLQANGVRVQIEGDDLIVHGQGGPPDGGGLVGTHMDHRLAMSALVLGAGARAAVAVDDVSFIDTSFPGFVALMTSLGCRFS